ncbi:MAG: phosphonate ABC transporter, permease protein PhnE [Anaerolineae bacterium]|jgi:phosphonate transport system permease protein
MRGNNEVRRRSRERLPSLTPAPVNGIASLLLPGLGQILARRVWRGLLVFASLASIAGLVAWRIVGLAHREPTPLAMLTRALNRRPFFIGAVVLGTILLWLWIAWDAYRQAHPGREGGPGVFVLILLLFFALGWQISEIDLYKAVTELSDTWPLLSKVLWPWEAATTPVRETVEALADIQVPCTENPPPVPEETPGEAYLKAEPTCGELSDLDDDNKIIRGTTLTLTGKNFGPNREIQIWWEDPIGGEFRIRQEGEYVTAQTDSQGSFQIDVVMPYRLVPPSAEGAQIQEIKARQITETGVVKLSEPLLLSIERMVETIFLGMMATAFGIVLAVPVSFLAARNLMSGSWFSVGVYYVVRGILNIVRSIEPLIWVIIAAQWVGLGPFAGIVALTIHTIAALGKLYSEAIESIDPGPIEAIQATGATGLQTIMYAVVPQMIPPFVSFSIYRWDINVRMSTVVGLVGGGGIGFLLVQYIRLLNFRAAGIAVWFIAITVAILDYVSAEIRERFV